MTRSYKVRIDVIRNGARVTTLTAASDPVIDGKVDAEIQTSLTGHFFDNPLVDWLNDELQPFQIINGQEHSVGIFRVGTVSSAWDENGVKTVDVEAYDRALILKQSKTESTMHFSKGERYLAVIGSLLVNAGIGLYLETPTDAALATDREDWEIGTPYLTIVNDLLNEIGYRKIWFNSAGIAILEPEVEPSVSGAFYQYGADANPRILKRNCSFETDIFDRPNVFVVVCSNPDLSAPLKSVAVNENPLSALSVFKRNRRIVQVIKVDNIPNQAALDAYAQKLCTQSMLAVETATISTANLPVRGSFETVALIHPDIEGLFQEVGWSLILAPGQTMLHHLRRSALI